MDVYAADFTGLVQSFKLRRNKSQCFVAFANCIVYVPVPGEVVRDGDT
jgi:hypothetical protein